VITGRKTEENTREREKAREREEDKRAQESKVEEETGQKIEQEREDEAGTRWAGISSSQVCLPPPTQGRARARAGCCPVWDGLWIKLGMLGREAVTQNHLKVYKHSGDRSALY
jgi:hypothetical protein